MSCKVTISFVQNINLVVPETHKGLKMGFWSYLIKDALLRARLVKLKNYAW